MCHRSAPPGLSARAVYPHALWAFGLLSVTGGIVGFRANTESLIRMALIVGRVASCRGRSSSVQRRRSDRSEEMAIDIRPTAVALIAGVVIAIAQIAPMLELPLFFQIAQSYAPLVQPRSPQRHSSSGLIVSGPVAGALLTRYQPTGP